MVDKASLSPQLLKAPLDQSGASGSDSGIEITPQMIEAGVEVYLGACPDTGAGDRVDREMVRQIFRSMIRVKSESIESQ